MQVQTCFEHINLIPFSRKVGLKMVNVKKLTTDELKFLWKIEHQPWTSLKIKHLVGPNLRVNL